MFQNEAARQNRPWAGTQRVVRSPVDETVGVRLGCLCADDVPVLSSDSKRGLTRCGQRWIHASYRNCAALGRRLGVLCRVGETRMIVTRYGQHAHSWNSARLLIL